MFEKHYRELKHFLLNRLRDHDLAADAAQECFSRAVAMQREGATVLDPRALLFKIANNLLIDEHRKQNSRPELISLDNEQEHGSLPNAAQPIHPEQIANANQQLEKLLTIINDLPPRCREAFVLFKFDGLSYQEIAQRMDISPRTVEMQIRIAMVACIKGLEYGNSSD